jgi:beta-phosphoglucomutase-like phosphatase (HAD superfamily)
MTKALIFDFDGVIVSSEQARFKKLQEISARYGLHIPHSYFKDILGRTTNDFYALTFPDIAGDKLESILSDFQIEYKDKIVSYVTPIQMTVDFIRSYSGDRLLAVASGSGKTVLTTVLKHLGIYDKFTDIIGKEDVTKHKPDPAVYLLAASRLNVIPKDCTVIEDTLVGAQAAIAAGMSVYVLLNGVNSKSEFENTQVSGFLASAEQMQVL